MIFEKLLKGGSYSSVEEATSTLERRGIDLTLNWDLKMRELLVYGSEVAWNFKRLVCFIRGTEFLVYFSASLLSSVESQ